MKESSYSEYKESGWEWFGKMPIGWEVKKLKYVVPGLTVGIVVNPSSYYVDNGVPALRSLNISTGKVEMRDLVFISAEANEAQSKSQIYDGDIVLVRTGRTGMAAIVPADLNGANCIDLLIVRKSALVLPQLLHYLLNSDAVNTQIDMQSCGAIQSHLNTSTLGELVIPLPPLVDQPKMLAFLDLETTKIDALIAEQRTLIDRLEEKRAATITQAVTKGLTLGTAMKPSGVSWLGEIPEPWEVRRVKSLCTFTTSGPRGWSERICEAGDLFIQSGDLNDKLQVEFNTAKRVRVEADAEAARTQLQNGDVLVCITGAKTGKVAVCMSVPETAYVNQHLCLIRPSSAILPTYLGLFLGSLVGQTYFDFSQYGLKQGLSLDDVREAPVFLPPLAEQMQLINFIEAATNQIDSLAHEAASSIAFLQEHRSALISAVVTGKVDVREVACV